MLCFSCVWILKNTIMLFTVGIYVIDVKAKTSQQLKATLTCDKDMVVYIDGKFAGTGNTTKKPSVFKLHPGARVLAVRCLNLQGEAGILGSLDNGLVTDSHWKCIGRNKHRRLRKGWAGVLFDDSHWPQAVAYFPNREWTWWGKITEISEKASWIWTADRGRHDEAYCRRRLSDVSVKHEYARKGMFQTTLHEIDHALVLHHRSRHEVSDVTQCAMRCRDDSQCVAFNFQHSSSSPVRQCELKDATRHQDPANYVKKPGYTYYEDVAYR